ncbi:transcriptional regulator [Flagellatimonas centrodinii]|uniref:transcriptional regulator n=1 Tax=Flagellatimonas centrodinii TaxID=2806210 RepID=UPI00345007A5
MTPIERAIVAAGGPSSLARSVGVSTQVVCNWRARGQVSDDKALDVERATGISRHELRPNIFGPAPTQEAA